MLVSENGVVAAPAELGEYMQRLASGGSLNAMEHEALRDAMVRRLHDPAAPLVVYECRGKLPNQQPCQYELVATNAPYGRARYTCPRCGLRQTLYYAGYQRQPRQAPA